MRIRGSTVCVTAMYATWVAYMGVCIWCRRELEVWPPAEMTYATAALFIAETASLARIRMAKEGFELTKREANPFLAKLGIGTLPDFEDEVQKWASAKHAADAKAGEKK